VRVKLVTYDDGKVGRVDDEEVVRLNVPTMREYFERGGADDTSERTSLADVRLRAPIIPKKFFHTAGNFREHEEESKNVDWSHAIAPWINFFQNVDAIVGPDEPIIYPGKPVFFADDAAVLRLRDRLAETDAAAVSVGSGSINDVVKNASDLLGRPYLAVCTAASVDGYTAEGAAITRQGCEEYGHLPGADRGRGPDRRHGSRSEQPHRHRLGRPVREGPRGRRLDGRRRARCGASGLGRLGARPGTSAGCDR